MKSVIEIPDGGFGFIMADNPWKFANFGAKKHGAARGHYAGISAEQLSEIPVGELAANNSILGMWSTWPKLEESLQVMKAWGFDYVTGLPWIKTSPASGTIRTGIGFWVQSTSEFILFGRKGNAKAPLRSKETPVQKGLLCGSELQFYAPVKDHSSKPLTIYDWAVSRLKGPYLELFARNQIHGWTCVGKDLGHWIDREDIHWYDPKTHGGELGDGGVEGT